MNNTFENIIILLKKFWSKNNCSIFESFDHPIGAGTLHPITFFSGINNKQVSIIYIQPSRRPLDSKYLKHIYKRQYYFQLQVIFKPIPKNIKYLYLKSLEYIGINIKKNDIKFIEDNWENPTLSSWGIGWEIHLNGVEITQFTYFQQIGGLYCYPIMIEITYGLERILMFIQNVKKISNIIWSKKNNLLIRYGDIFDLSEIEYSYYNIKYANIKNLIYIFEKYINEANELLFKKKLIFPTYDLILKAIHNFNILESRNYFSILERKFFIIKIQNISKSIANIYNKKLLNKKNEKFNKKK